MWRKKQLSSRSGYPSCVPQLWFISKSVVPRHQKPKPLWPSLNAEPFVALSSLKCLYSLSSGQCHGRQDVFLAGAYGEPQRNISLVCFLLAREELPGLIKMYSEAVTELLPFTTTTCHWIQSFTSVLQKEQSSQV